MFLEFFEILILIFLYLFSSIHSGYLIVNLFYSKNIYTIGYKNSGFSNVYKVFGIKSAIFVGIYDLVIKGIIPIYLLTFLDFSKLILYLSAVVIVCGHMFSVFHSFKGGRGILTTIGIGLAFGLLKEIALVVTIFKILEIYWWKNNALSTFLGIITFMFIIPFLYDDYIFIICFELIFILLLFKRIITNNMNMNLDLGMILRRILFDSNLNK